MRLEGDEFLDEVRYIQVTELIDDCLGIMQLLGEIEPYVVETGSEGRLSEMRLSSFNDDVHSLVQLFIKDYSYHPCPDSEVQLVIEDLKTVRPGDHEKIATILGWPEMGETGLHDLAVRPRGYRLLKQVAKIPQGTADKVVAQFKDFVNLTTVNKETLQEVDGIGEKRAQSIIEGIRHMRNRSIYL